jgi:hypothetical protein
LDSFQKIMVVLRSVAHGPPEHRAWRRALRVMGELRQPAQIQVALDYLRHALDQWPDHLRTFSPQDWRDCQRGPEDPHPIWPLVRRAHLPSCEVEDIRKLQSWCARSPLRHLQLHLDRQEALELLLDDTNLENLRTLRLRSSHLGTTNAARLLGVRWRHLETLDLFNNWWTGLGLEGLREAAPRLKVLRLDINNVDMEHLRALIRRGHPTLEVLGLRQTELPPEPLLRELEQATGPGGSLPRLRHIPIEPLRLGQAGADEATWDRWSRYQLPEQPHVTLSRDFSDQDVVRVLASGHLDPVEQLSVYKHGLGQDALQALCRRPLKNLHTLRLHMREPWGLAQRQTLAAAPWASQLRVLSLQGGQGDLAPLLSIPALKNLEVVSLQDARMSQEALVKLAQITPAAPLRALNLQYNDLHQAALEALTQSPWVRQLEVCQISFDRVKADAALVCSCPPMHPRSGSRWPAPWYKALTNVDDHLRTALRGLTHNHQAVLPILEINCPASLFIHWARLSSEAVNALAHAQLRGVKHLSFIYHRFAPGDLGNLLSAPWVRHLESLSLINCDLDQRDLDTLARWRPVALRELSLRHNSALKEEEHLARLRAAPWMAQVEKFTV